tara:strand:- start:9809 stop:9919 length:111 start_codon:yes stop_codon:yes gene_type:complete
MVTTYIEIKVFSTLNLAHVIYMNDPAHLGLAAMQKN